MTTQTAIYIRVSTQEQKLHGISVDAQEAACRAWVREHGHALAGVYNDAGLSARARYTKRSAMLRLIDDIRGGRVDLIVFTKLDRWFRNVADYYEVQAILEAHDVKWRAIEEDYETETASGRFKVNIMLAVAQDEADRTSERIRAAAGFKRQKGEAVGRPALGYKIEDKHWVIDPAAKPGIDAFFSAYLETLSTKKAMAAAAAHGIVLNQTHAMRILRNPTYRGDAFGVPCPAYISQAQYDAIRRNAGRRTRLNKTGRVYLFSGLMRCGCCGGAMTSAFQPKGGGIKYYHCQNRAQRPDVCPGGYANERKVEAFLLKNLPGVLDDLTADARQRRAEDHTKAIQAARGRLERLKELYIEGDIDRAAYDARAALLREEIDRLERMASRPAGDAVLPSDWKALYAALTDAGKKLFWRRAVRRIEITGDREPVVTF